MRNQNAVSCFFTCLIPSCEACDALVPAGTNLAAFTTVKHLSPTDAAYVEGWDVLASTTGSYCPRGCDADAPDYASSAAFANANWANKCPTALFYVDRSASDAARHVV